MTMDEASKRIDELEREVVSLRRRLAQSPRAIEMHYSVAQIALLLGFSERWVRVIFLV